MKQFHLFINYRFFGSVTGTSLLDALNKHQIRNSTTMRQMFTAMDPQEGYAFSQTYVVVDDSVKPRKVSWGHMFKHEAGLENPGDIPSYDDLFKAVPTPC